MQRIEVTDITVSYRGAARASLRGVSCSIEPGRITLLLGRSGSGKTTLLKAILGLVPVKGGTIDRCLDPGFFAYVPQSLDLFPHLSVLGNCVQPQRVVQKTRRSDATKRAYAQLASLGISDLAHRFPSELSGGQRQRVAVARALISGAKFLGLDEPSSALDGQASLQLAELLRELCRKGIGIIVSTHDAKLAAQLQDRAYLLEDGAIIAAQDGQVDESIASYLRPGEVGAM